MTTILQINELELKSALRDVVLEVIKDFHTEVPEAPKPDRITDVREVAEITGLSVSKIYKMAPAGELPCARYGPRRLVFSRKALEAWIEDRTRPMGESLDAITMTARKRNNKRS